jgi:flagellar hook-basal body complex protein FliE
MNVFNVGAAGASGAADFGSLVTGSGAVESGDGGGFGQLLQGLTDAAAGADQAVTDVALGTDADLHDVTLAVEMESLAFDLAVQIRNRLVDAYQEVFRMSV